MTTDAATLSLRETPQRCGRGHDRCHQPGNAARLERGCGCCECLRTTTRYPDCFGCTLPGCACHVPYAEEKPMTGPPPTIRSLSHAGARTPSQRRTRGCRQPAPKPRKDRP